MCIVSIILSLSAFLIDNTKSKSFFEHLHGGSTLLALSLGLEFYGPPTLPTSSESYSFLGILNKIALKSSGSTKLSWECWPVNFICFEYP